MKSIEAHRFQLLMNAITLLVMKADGSIAMTFDELESTFGVELEVHESPAKQTVTFKVIRQTH